MINIITAIGIPNLNNELKKYNEFNVICNDIIYFDGIIEIIESCEEINYLIIGEKLLQENIEFLISKIIEKNKKIKLIAIINKKQKSMEQDLIRRGIYDIFYDDIEINEIINILKTKNIEYLNCELRAEIENLKKLISEKNNKNNIKEINNIKNKIIGVIGTNGIGKSTFCMAMAEILKNKILIVDFDIFKAQISQMYNKKIEYSKLDINQIKNNIINVNEKTDILLGINYLFYYKKYNFKNIKKELDEIKYKYDFILIDTCFEDNSEINRFILEIFDEIILLGGINDIDYQKSEYFIKKYNLYKFNNINFIVYKYKKYELFKNIKNNGFRFNYIRKNRG